MRYTTHKLPVAEIETGNQNAGQKLDEAGQWPAVERSESVEALRIEQELMTHADGVLDELEEPANTVTDFDDANPRSADIDRSVNGSTSASNNFDDQRTEIPTRNMDG